MKKITILLFTIFSITNSYSQNYRMIDNIKDHEAGTMAWWAGNNSWVIKSNDLVIATDLFLEEQPPYADGSPFGVTPCQLHLRKLPVSWIFIL